MRTAATIALGLVFAGYLRWLAWRERRGIRTPQEAEAERRARLRAERTPGWPDSFA